MNSTPLVSVAMPCYNSVESLPLALASLMSQTYDNWECLVVDDGSTDNTEEVVREINDPRIHYVKLDRNMGRGFARQVALDTAKGRFLSMLDSDDWIYPQKLERQVEVMVQESDLAVLSAGLAIVDLTNSLIGVRSYARSGSLEVRGPLNSLPRTIPVAHGSSMVKMDLAKRVRYDSSLHRVQDFDFLLQVMLGNVYGVLPEIFYAYTEIGSLTRTKLLAKLLESCKCQRQVFRKHRQRFPFRTKINLMKSYFRELVYRPAFLFKLEDRLIGQRSNVPSSHHKAEFDLAWSIVRSSLGDLGLSS